ncbi:uncharacterized protein A1O9_10416 [Exophiala aquamarina CBS 119918]|uniref:Uncharacterized protein n=1 Tax=Exophiala aquamarina CBS 119918 TaxID=1182545 RepID=A0A072P0S2_9EURO|nr:uncharacterized protein A1O9_10416 [Exophiala aquamarina CBS 119918]KEF53441.1 hypothetical protein A1O9_10416 [Exophiala aquamarina CBS 119918]
MSSAKPAYDPVKTVEGMFNGSVTRIAYVLKDPLNYAQSTKAVLAETAKKFQDALDDCEIQILDVKWYLERQLTLNKERREAKAREDSAAAVSAKRKLDDIKDAKGKAQDTSQDHAPKRVKTAEPEEPVQSKPQPPSTTAAPVAPNGTPKQPAKPLDKPTTTGKPADKFHPQSQSSAPTPAANRKPSVSTETKAHPSTAPPKPKAQHKPPEPIQVPPPATISTSKPLTTHSFTLDDYPRATPQDTPAGGNEDFNFVSMFGEPSGTDMMDGTNGDMNFDMNIGNEFDIDPTAAAAAQDSSLTSLLPGLESYAHQTSDDNSFNLAGINMDGTDGAGALDFNANPQQPPQPAAPGVNVNDFGLPTLGPNEFDDFLNSNDMSFDAGDDNMMNMESMESMDFDSMFN